jgi:hypothetical protein
VRIIKESEKTERQKKIFKIADEMYTETFDFSMDYMNKIKEDPAFEEMQDFEVISFFANVYTKIFCHGFTTMLDLKREIMKEHESTEKQLLDEWVDGIYVFLGQRKNKPSNEKQLPDGIKGVKAR